MDKINVTKSFMPPFEEYQSYIKQIWGNGQLTNQGPFVHEFERKTEEYLGVKYLHFVTNGTLALQIALKALDINDGEIITTPFSYVATTSAILWQGCKPVFVDIDPQTLCIDPQKIEQAITKKTKAILPVHVFGNPCDIGAIEKIAAKHKLKVIYDGAHGFGVKYKGKSLLSYGDISICSFHATKPFHTIEGGCVVANSKEVSDRVELIKRFGHHGDKHYMLGINAKATEFQAAMGLCNLKYVEDIIEGRRKKTELYDRFLKGKVERPSINDNTDYNYAYYPILLKDEHKRANIIRRLNKENIFPRRYFYPSLNTLPYITDKQNCPVSEDVSSRILCLPLYMDLKDEVINKICEVVCDNV